MGFSLKGSENQGARQARPEARSLRGRERGEVLGVVQPASSTPAKGSG